MSLSVFCLEFHSWTQTYCAYCYTKIVEDKMDTGRWWITGKQ